MKQVKVDRTEVRLSSFEPASAEVTISNQMPGSISLSLSFNGFPGFKARLDRTNLASGESAKILLECKPEDQRPKPTLTVRSDGGAHRSGDPHSSAFRRAARDREATTPVIGPRLAYPPKWRKANLMSNTIPTNVTQSRLAQQAERPQRTVSSKTSPVFGSQLVSAMQGSRRAVAGAGAFVGGRQMIAVSAAGPAEFRQRVCRPSPRRSRSDTSHQHAGPAQSVYRRGYCRDQAGNPAAPSPRR